MRITQNRVDSWLIKGLDGASGFTEEKAANTPKISKDNLRKLRIIIENLETVLADVNYTEQDLSEDLFFLQVLTFTQLLLARTKQMGGLSLFDRANLEKYLSKFKYSYQRMVGNASLSDAQMV